MESLPRGSLQRAGREIEKGFQDNVANGYAEHLGLSSSTDFNLLLAMDDDVPPWSSLYSIHSEIKRLLGPPNAESCLSEDIISNNSQRQSEVEHEKRTPPRTSSETSTSNNSRPLSQSRISRSHINATTLLLTDSCQLHLFKRTNLKDPCCHYGHAVAIKQF